MRKLFSTTTASHNSATENRARAAQRRWGAGMTLKKTVTRTCVRACICAIRALYLHASTEYSQDFLRIHTDRSCTSNEFTVGVSFLSLFFFSLMLVAATLTCVHACNAVNSVSPRAPASTAVRAFRHCVSQVQPKCNAKRLSVSS